MDTLHAGKKALRKCLEHVLERRCPNKNKYDNDDVDEVLDGKRVG
jgi:hypothetical protein